MEVGFISWGDAKDVSAEGAANGRWRIGGAEIRDTIEDLIREIWLKVKGIKLAERFTVMSYQEAMHRVRCSLLVSSPV